MRNRTIFFGTPFFASSILEYLIKEGLTPLAVVTQPDRPKGRELNIFPSPVKEITLKHLPNHTLFQPQKASQPEFIQEIRLLKPDLFVVVGYGQILKQELLDIPKLGAINIHASLLPKYRGAAPMQRSLMAGEKKTGITIMKLVQEMDAGDILAQSELEMPLDMNFEGLQEKMLELSKPLLKNTLLSLDKGSLPGKAQNHNEATYARKLAAEEFHLAWDFPAIQVHNLIRALSPKPGAWCWAKINGERKRLKILKTKFLSLQGEAPGQISKNSQYPFIVGCQKDSIALLEVQLEGKKVMDIASFLLGVKEIILI
jgi:methionyl-tRNA formyltransferase